MKKDAAFWLTLLFVAVALAASAILLVDYVRPAPVFCEATGDCAKVRETVFARPLGIPLPAIGLLGMLAIGLAALVPGITARKVELVLAAIGGANALVLFGVQAKLKALCPFCAIVDTSAIVLAGLALHRFLRATDPPAKRRLVPIAAGALTLAIAIPLVVGFSRRALPGGLPAVVAEEMQRTGSSKVTIVDFADFECPFCRMTHAELAPLVLARKDKVRVARKYVPLAQHRHAMDAAKAGCCGEAQGKADEIADALFTAPVEDLTPEGCEKIAARLGLDLDRFRSCVKDPATQARIEKDKQAWRASKSHGLPTIWFDDHIVEGAQDKESLGAALDAALRAL